MEVNDILVRFDKYCKRCKYSAVYEKDEPCNECLENGDNISADAPVRFVEKETSQKIRSL